MAIRKRTTKSVAKRHDLNYFKKGSPIRLWQWRLALAALAAAIVWLGLAALRSANVFSAGPVSNAHAVFGAKCEACHVPVVAHTGWLPILGNRRTVPDSACLACHTATGPHHASLATTTQPCSTCHVEHTGSMHLAATPDQGCTHCHANLTLTHGTPTIATHIESFTKGHPDFRPLRVSDDPEARVQGSGPRAQQTPSDPSALNPEPSPFGLKFNHAAHLKPNLTGPNGATKVTLTCASCHQVADTPGRDRAHSGLMAPVDFDQSCRSCHSLDFDRAVAQQAPHSTAANAFTFLRDAMAHAHHGDQAALVRAETILFRGKCSLCHQVTGAEALPNIPLDPSVSPVIAPARQPERFFPSAVFSHTTHSAVRCEECHQAALASTSGKDLLLPSITTCQRCHDGLSRPQGPALANGHAESGCVLCHVYHQPTSQSLAAAQPHPAYRIEDLVPHH